jgi:membrane protease YdiL (CAAX protease family)
MDQPDAKAEWMPSTPQPKGSSTPSAAVYWRRCLVVTLFVGLWMALGFWFKLDANLYLLLGVPMTALFQIFVQRRPIRALWVRTASPPRFGVGWLLLAAALASLPIYESLAGWVFVGWVVIGWMACAILGAPAAVYCIQNINHRVAHAVPPAAAIVVFLSIAMMFAAVMRKGFGVFTIGSLLETLRWTWLYFTVSFFLEEVTFRGALDSYVYRPEDKRGYLSAVAIGFLWGLWHLPIVSWQETGLLMTVVQLVIAHTVVGVFLSMSWRIGGNLLVPAAAHALIDGIRNGLGLMT